MITVLGGTGRFGSRLVARLEGIGYPVRVMARTLATSGTSDRVRGDLRQQSDVERACAGADLIVMAVHGLTDRSRHALAEIDVAGTIRVADVAARSGAEVILMSVLGASPDSPVELFRSKYAAESALGDRVPRATVVRSPAFLETWSAIMEHTAGRSGRPLVFGRGSVPWDFVAVDDVVDEVTRIVIEPTARGGTVQLRGPERLTLTELAELVQQRHQWAGRPRHLPRAGLRVQARIGVLSPGAARLGRMALSLDSAPVESGPPVLLPVRTLVGRRTPGELLLPSSGR